VRRQAALPCDGGFPELLRYFSGFKSKLQKANKLHNGLEFRCKFLRVCFRRGSLSWGCRDERGGVPAPNQIPDYVGEFRGSKGIDGKVSAKQKNRAE